MHFSVITVLRTHILCVPKTNDAVARV